MKIAMERDFAQPVYLFSTIDIDGNRVGPEISMIITTSRDITQISTAKTMEDAPARALLNAGKLQKLSQEDLAENEILANSESMKNVMTLTKRLASVNTTVLITGESGAGKGFIASTLHNQGTRWRVHTSP